MFCGFIYNRYNLLIFMLKSYFLKRQFFITSHSDQIKEHYEFIKEIGRGAFGIVYRARQKLFPNQTRVIKRISKKKVKNPLALINQIKAMANLDHPHILKLYETFEDQNNLFLVLDYCEGGELYTRLCSQSTFSEGRARTIFRQMVNAVLYMHTKKVAHRDLKLQNFMMVSSTSWDLMLIDFGLAFQWQEDMRTQVKEAEQGKIVGTPYYIAPEILSHSYNEKCDVWSLGVILYMLVTGTPAFDGKNDKEILQNIKKHNYSLKTKECQILSANLLDLLFRTLQLEDQRISLQQILEHKWVTEAQPMNDVLLNLQFNKIIEFSHSTKLKKMVATYIATQLSECQIEQMRDLFESIDVNQDGYITVQELQGVIKQKEGQIMALGDLQKMLFAIDTDQNGKINYNEFLAICVDEAVITNENYLQFVFKSFDLNGDGKIQREQFQLILKVYSKDFKCNQLLVDALMSENDKNKDGAIDFNQFKNAMAGIQQKGKLHVKKDNEDGEPMDAE